MDKEAEFEWFDLAEVNEIVVPNLNEVVISLEFESTSVVEDSFKKRQRVDAAGDRSANDAAADEYIGCDEMMDNDSGYDAGNDDAWYAGSDNYESEDDSGSASDLSSDDEIQDVCNKYEANSG